jgi:hypothetical protein
MHAIYWYEMVIFRGEMITGWKYCKNGEEKEKHSEI